MIKEAHTTAKRASKSHKHKKKQKDLLVKTKDLIHQIYSSNTAQNALNSVAQLKLSKGNLKDASFSSVSKVPNSGKAAKESLAGPKATQLPRSPSKQALASMSKKSARKAHAHYQKSEYSTCNSVRMRSPAGSVANEQEDDLQ